MSVTFTPANTSDQSISWSSDDDSIATVDQNGYVYGKKAGTTTIRAYNSASGLSASISLTVTGVFVAHNQTEVNEVINLGTVPDEMIIDTDEPITIESSLNTYPLIVKGTGTVTNHACFGGITLAGTNKFIEDNQTNVDCNFTITNAATLNLKHGMFGEINVNLSDPGADQEVNIESYAYVGKLNISSAAKVNFTGSLATIYPMKVNITAKDVTFSSAVKCEVNATEKANLAFSENAAGSTVTIDRADHMPNITGTGSYEVTNSATGEKTTVDAK